MKKLIYLLLTLLIVGCSDDDGNPCLYNPTLTTSAVSNISETSTTLNGVISIVSQNCEDPTNIEQGFVYATTIQPTTANNKVNVNGTDVTTTLENLEPNTTYYVRAFLTNTLGEFYGNEVSFITSEEPVTCDVVYLADNGVTIKAYPCASIGDVGTINGVDYTVVDNNMLYILRGEVDTTITADFTKLCTTRVTDMNALFLCYEDFNQPIGHWDVSNVTNMYAMFYSECAASNFNQNISYWDVSNVIDMSYMFGGSAGGGGAFNQPIENWDVSSVTNMSGMFESATSFNQNLSSWEVSSVTDMNSMFSYAQAFNQPIGNWDVSNVTDMSYMFYSATAFNQDLSSWNVNNVTNYDDFSSDTPNWTLPKPNF